MSKFVVKPHHNGIPWDYEVNNKFVEVFEDFEIRDVTKDAAHVILNTAISRWLSANFPDGNYARLFECLHYSLIEVED
jgi:hypothetical protein